MGYKLYREVKGWAPASLTYREKLTALVLADDANEVTRLTWHSVVDPEIMRQAMIKSERDMRKVVARLQDEKVIEHAGGGHNGKVAKYRFLHLAPPSGKPGENHPATPPEGVRKDPPTHAKEVRNEPATTPVGGPERTPYTDGQNGKGGEKDPATQPVGGPFPASSRSEKDLPTPPTTSTTSSSPVAEADARPPTGGAGRKEEAPQEQNDTTTAAAFLEALPEPWGVGRVTAAALAPLLTERAAERRWALDAALTEELTKNPGGINDHRRVLRSRIEDLKYRLRPPAQRTAEQPDRACVDCGRPHPNLTDTGICPPCLSGQNSDARRPMPADFRQAIRRARATAPEGDPR